MEHRHEITDQEWERIKNMFQSEYPMKGKRVRPGKYDNRGIMNGILYCSSSKLYYTSKEEES